MSTEIKQNAPLVSVIMPAYNAEPFIREAITSVINQTETNWELFVVDDRSTDKTYQVAKELEKIDPRICVMRNEVNMGVANTRNVGIHQAKGQYIAFLDSDDVWLPNKLQLQLSKLTEHDANICYCSYAIIGPQGNPVKQDYIVPEHVNFDALLKENVMQCSAMLIKSEIVKEFMFKTDYFHEDYVLGLDMLRRGYRAVGCTDILLNWRYLENSRSFNKRKAAKNRWHIYRDYLELPFWKASFLFLCYTMAGLRKYLRKYR